MNLVNCVKEEIRIELGTATAEAGESAYTALDQATRDLEEGKIDLLVTLPINKDTIQNDQFRFPDIPSSWKNALPKGEKAMMILASEMMKVALVTTHLPLSEVPGRLSPRRGSWSS